MVEIDDNLAAFEFGRRIAKFIHSRADPFAMVRGDEDIE